MSDKVIPFCPPQLRNAQRESRAQHLEDLSFHLNISTGECVPLSEYEQRKRKREAIERAGHERL